MFHPPTPHKEPSFKQLFQSVSSSNHSMCVIATKTGLPDRLAHSGRCGYCSAPPTAFKKPNRPNCLSTCVPLCLARSRYVHHGTKKNVAECAQHDMVIPLVAPHLGAPSPCSQFFLPPDSRPEKWRHVSPESRPVMCSQHALKAKNIRQLSSFTRPLRNKWCKTTTPTTSFVLLGVPTAFSTRTVCITQK